MRLTQEQVEDGLFGVVAALLVTRQEMQAVFEVEPPSEDEFAQAFAEAVADDRENPPVGEQLWLTLKRKFPGKDGGYNPLAVARRIVEMAGFEHKTEASGTEIVPEKVLRMVAGLPTGTELELTFKAGRGLKGTLDGRTQNAVQSLVLGSVGVAKVGMNDGDQMDYYAVGDSGYWDIVRRTVIVKILSGFDPAWFVTRIAQGLESIKIKEVALQA